MKPRGMRELIEMLAVVGYDTGTLTIEEKERLLHLSEVLHEQGKNAGTRKGMEEVLKS